MSDPVKAAKRDLPGRLRKSPGTEVEIKLQVPDKDAIIRRLSRLKARKSVRLHEKNILYDTHDGALLRNGKLVRIRTVHPVGPSGTGRPAVSPAGHSGGKLGAVLTFKGPTAGTGGTRSRYKIRQEHEIHVEDVQTLERILAGLGMHPSFRYEKYRTTFGLPGEKELVIELDETPIGDFLELEGTPEAIDSGAAVLGYGAADYITKSYGQLFSEWRRKAGRLKSSDMLFGPPRASRAGHR